MIQQHLSYTEMQSMVSKNVVFVGFQYNYENNNIYCQIISVYFQEKKIPYIIYLALKVSTLFKL